ncbi:MAG: PD-(D/E)XK nuclease family protein [Planctomycetes bacterium]|nr:PD-(D/E)XK nuclease family protein [Planctomycetota bacterium]
MGRTLLVGPLAHPRLAAVSAWLAARAPGDECVLVTHDAAAGSALLRALVADPDAPRAAAFGRHRTTLTGLAASLAAPVLAARGLIPVGRLGAEALLTRVLHEARARDALGRMRRVADAPGLARALLAVLTELREDDVEDLDAHDALLAALRDDYERALARDGLVDRAGLLRLATEVARADDDGPAGRHAWLGLPLALLDPLVTSRAEQRLLAALAARAPDVIATLPVGDERSRAHLETLLGVAAQALPRDDETPDALQRLASGLFDESAAAGGRVELGEHVTLLSAPGEGRESVEIVRRVLRFARVGVPFDRMAVLLRAPELYRDHLEEAFERAGVPVHFARGVRRPDPGGRALHAMLACAAEGLSARRFAEYLSLGEVPDAPAGRPPDARPASERFFETPHELAELMGRPRAHDDRLEEASDRLAHVFDEDDEPLARDDETSSDGESRDGVRDGDDDVRGASSAAPPGTVRAPRRWETLLVDASVVGGHARWKDRLAGLRSQLSLSLAGLDDPDDPFDPRAAALRRDVAAVDSLAAFALPLLDDLAALPGEATWGEWIDELSALATRALRHPDHVLAVLAEMLPMAALGPVPLEQVRLVLAERLLATTVRGADDPAGRVSVLPIESARGRAFDVVFVPGLAERVFPGRVAEDPILRDERRAALDAALVTNTQRIARERLLLRLAAGAARTHLVLSYPRLDQEQARPRVPSFYALEALRAAEGELPGFDELAERAETTADTRLGWPAPSRPEDAIDESEHDLALLDTLLDRPELHAVGTARYLLAANPHLGRALRFRARRWRPGWTQSDGLVKPDPRAARALAAHAIGARPYSVTALQHFASCPYRFLLAAVHRLEPREEAAGIETLDPLQRGALVHAVLRDVLQRLHDQGALPVRPATLDAARAVLDEELDRHAGRARDELVPAIPRVWDEGIALLRADLCEWLRRMASDDSGWTPLRFELGFGLPAREGMDAKSAKDPVRVADRIVLRGAIDMVERHADGRLRVTDHKTGRLTLRKDAVVDGGRTLQPVFYALALEQLVPAARVAGGRLASCTSAGRFEERVVPLDDKARWAAEQVAGAIGTALEQGFLPAAPAPDACRRCDYRAVCGPYEELRTAKKTRKGLLSLRVLRDLP